jgi:AraC-like DNA-binding protein
MVAPLMLLFAHGFAIHVERWMVRACREGMVARARVAGVSRSGPAPVERDSRGILDPWLLRQRVRLTRYPAGAALERVVDRLWAVRWDLPPGVVHQQQVLTHPAANVSVGNANGRPGDSEARPVEARLNGVARRLATRVLAGHGWAVAAMARPGGLGAFITGPASALTDRIVPLGEAIATDEPVLLARIVAEPDEAARIGLLAAALEDALHPDRVEPASQVAGVARLAETNREVRRLTDLCDLAGIRPRTLQRMFGEYAGVSPTWVIRRYRLQEAAEAVRDGASVSWAQVAADLGYADQAHLVRDFRAAIGQTPAAYAEAQHPARRS